MRKPSEKRLKEIRKRKPSDIEIARLAAIHGDTRVAQLFGTSDSRVNEIYKRFMHYEFHGGRFVPSAPLRRKRVSVKHLMKMRTEKFGECVNKILNGEMTLLGSLPHGESEE